MSAAIALAGLRKSFGITEIIRGVDLEVAAGERHAIIGPNGAGKSTLFHLVSGRFAPSAGEIRLDGRRIDRLPPHRIARLGLARSFQVTTLFPRLTVHDNLRCALLWSMGYGHSFWHLLGRERRLNERAEALADSVGLGPRRASLAGDLPYADQRALEIGVAIASDPAVLLLDEPTAGMSRSETDGIVALIRRVSEGRTLVMVEHDMGVVFGLADRISVLVYGAILATGRPEEIRANRAVQEAYLGAAEEAGA